MSRIDHLKKLYELLDQLEHASGGKQSLRELGPAASYPRKGVYFFFEPGEERTCTGRGPRLTRVGTHGLVSGAKSTLRQRLSQHRGNATGGGNHRGSIFRLLVGEALSARGSCQSSASWGRRNSFAAATLELRISRSDLKASEAPIESAVSHYLGRMSFVLLPIDDEPGRDSLRGLIERNTIALLSNLDREPLDAPSSAWLGRSSVRRHVAVSGLWNQRHVDQTYDPEFLQTFADLASSV